MDYIKLTKHLNANYYKEELDTDLVKLKLESIDGKILGIILNKNDDKTYKLFKNKCDSIINLNVIEDVYLLDTLYDYIIIKGIGNVYYFFSKFYIIYKQLDHTILSYLINAERVEIFKNNHLYVFTKDYNENTSFNDDEIKPLIEVLKEK